MRKHVTMKDIAQEMDVSIVTVSKALSGKDGVSDELRDRIETKANELGYVYKNSGSGGNDRNLNIAIMISEHFISDNAFYFKVYQRMIMELSAKGFIGILEIVRTVDEENGNLPKLVQLGTVDQVVIIGEMKQVFLESLNNAGISMIFFDFENEDFDVDCIVGDNLSGGYAMTKYLVEKGYRNIAFVGSYKVTKNILDRLMGHLKYKLEKDLPKPDSWLIPDRDRNGLSVEIGLPEDMPEAFFCNCDETAYRLIRKLNESGYRVPEDIAVVGFDDYAAQIPEGIRLTTYRVNTKEMIRQCMHIVEQRSSNPLYRRGVVPVHGKLIERETVVNKILN